MRGDKQWISCTLAPGMFTDEWAVEVLGRWFFVDARHVRQEGVRSGKLEVSVFDDDGSRWAVIPSPERATIVLGA